uniref:Uncharacterized protein n=1 Tax=Panagrolaimus sp. ES5 TaxID=591445 RepID=A0AC34GCA0_9BILA
MGKTKPTAPIKTKKDNNAAVQRCRIRKNEQFQQAQIDEKHLLQEIEKRQANIKQIIKRFESHMASLPPSVSKTANVQRMHQKFNQISKAYTTQNTVKL